MGRYGSRVCDVPWTIREGIPGDFEFLTSMLAHAAVWQQGADVPESEAVLAIPELARYIGGWPRPGDFALFAVGPAPIGAVWWRQLTAREAGFGYVADDIPEIAMAVRPDCRGRGIGTTLLQGLIATAEGEGLPALSLSVDRENPAIHLYERLGFTAIGGAGSSLTMVRRF